MSEDMVALAAGRGGVDPETLADEERRKSWLGRVLDEFGRGASGEAWALLGPMPPPSQGATSGELQGLIREAIEETAAPGEAVLGAHAAFHATGERGEGRALPV